MEFHITKSARDKYQFDELLFSNNGNVIFANFQAAREFAHKINLLQSDSSDQSTFVSPGQINALGLIDEIFHLVISEYSRKYNLNFFGILYTDLVSKLSKEKVDSTLEAFNDLFPPVSVYQGQLTSKEYLHDSTQGISNKFLILEEILTTWLSNINPAASPYREIFDDSKLLNISSYSQLIDGINVFFKKQPPFGPDNTDLVTMLQTPALLVPHSLDGQLEYIREKWSAILGAALYKLLGALDLIAEENKFALFGAGTGPGPTYVPDYTVDAWGEKLSEIENFSPDSDWMPKVVMLAKNSFVWLNQLSRQYQRPIDRLDQIPDETLDQLSEWGFTGLWLIGLWERSEASREIKQRCGNPDAVSSAYSLADYQIASRLGGEDAYQNLSWRCGKRGIKLASDMVPNHMGIDSNWVMQHPDWFISLDYSPFPSYSFDGPDLSKNSEVSINLEDHYYTRSDAAVVFKRYDHRTGSTKFIYHGNDGTSMPWNDTAQLNYLNPEVREAVIQTILSVARKFPIIRFDAAMTLTKKHYQRLWFPQPGSGGDIPSRADHAMTREAFNAAMPEEFWREVVDRVAAEVPDTLLLAEAFWLMEGYFVRTLGMHRVYNSAFMNMLRNEENEKYRQLIKNTLVYDPEILKRYVNFMNNPDEKTAVEQFGKGDKYFGICSLLSTMPGLPMFGHGQIEGFSEKYGMEYYRPYWDETPDYDLVQRHKTDIFPLIHRRKIFANVEKFRLYDFFTDQGYVDENVFAYSNCQDAQAALVIYNNRFENTSGWIKISAPYLVKTGNAHLESTDLCDALELNGGINEFVVYKDFMSKQFYISSVQRIRDQGLHFSLNAYQSHVLIDFKIVSGKVYSDLAARLNGQGVWDLDAAIQVLLHAPVLESLGKVINFNNLSKLVDSSTSVLQTTVKEDLLDSNVKWLFEASQAAKDIKWNPQLADLPEDKKLRDMVEKILSIETMGGSHGFYSSNTTKELFEEVSEKLISDPRKKYILLVWAFMSQFSGAKLELDSKRSNLEWLQTSGIKQLITRCFKDCGFSEYESFKNYQAVTSLVNNTEWIKESEFANPLSIFKNWLEDSTLIEFIEVNEYNSTRWFNKERFEDLIWYQKSATILNASSTDTSTKFSNFEKILWVSKLFKKLEHAAEASGYKLDKLLELLN